MGFEPDGGFDFWLCGKIWTVPRRALYAVVAFRPSEKKLSGTRTRPLPTTGLNFVAMGIPFRVVRPPVRGK
jgi:hypothetical protein